MYVSKIISYHHMFLLSVFKMKLKSIVFGFLETFLLAPYFVGSLVLENPWFFRAVLWAEKILL